MNSESKPKKSIAVTVRLPTEIVDEIDAKSDDRAEFIRNIILEARRNDYKLSSIEIKKEPDQPRNEDKIEIAEELESTKKSGKDKTEIMKSEDAEITEPKQINDIQIFKDQITLLNGKIDMLQTNQQIMTQYMTTMQQLLQQKRVEGEIDKSNVKPWWKFW
jgi:hypothetical protein